MPELPEVQTIVNELSLHLPGRKIESIRFLRKNILQQSEEKFRKTLTGQKFQEIFRRGKYIAMLLDNKAVLTIHLRMTGKLIFLSDPDSLHIHDRWILNLEDGTELRFNDSRTLGKINLCETISELPQITGEIGIDPVASEFLNYDLWKELKRSNSTIKSFLMNSKKIAGIGNIYAAEILFRAKIHPQRSCEKISRVKSAKLQEIIVQVLLQALEKNGTTVSDFRRVDSKTGEFQNFLQVYGKQDQPCSKCGTRIKKIVLNQRGTCFCPHCQK